MARQKNSLGAMDIILWSAQVVLATVLFRAGFVKLLQPTEKLSAAGSWVSQASDEMVKFIGTIELLGATGLILPSILQVKPKLTPAAALGIFILMICATLVNIHQREGLKIIATIFLAFMAAFIAWGRWKENTRFHLNRFNYEKCKT